LFNEENTVKNLMIRLWNNALKPAFYTMLILGASAGGGSCQSHSHALLDVRPKVVEAGKLRPGLVISMSVLGGGKQEIDEPAKRVSDNGTIVLPLLGEMTVADMGLDDLQQQLTERYKKYYIAPQIILDFVRNTEAEGISPWGYVTVLGRVQKPGRVAVPATRDMTVSGVIQKAGGFASSAKDNAILITRLLPNGETETHTVNLRSVGAGGRVEEDILLRANDVVFVPEAMF
jgi:protein involved in polysaccharide export with SLBB domain